MKIEHTEIYGYRAAMRGMRNPMDSWAASDSGFLTIVRLAVGSHELSLLQTDIHHEPCSVPLTFDVNLDCTMERPHLGPKDLELACKLIRQGGDHRKFLRYIVVTCDFVLPRYVWQEVDTYKVGTVRNSCSTMNTLGKRHLKQEDFENGLPDFFLAELNRAVDEFQEAEGTTKRCARVILKDLLPEGFLQRATFLLNYEVGYRMFFSRRKHRLPMWREHSPGSICEWIKSWPYMPLFLEAGAKPRILSGPQRPAHTF